MLTNISTLKAVRESRGLSQERLAQKVGCARMTIANIEAMRQSPNVGLAAQIAEVLDYPDIAALFDVELSD